MKTSASWWNSAANSGQGYLFAKPMTEQELMGMVMAARSASKSADQPVKNGAISPKAE